MTKRFGHGGGSVEALAGVDVRIEAGQFVAVLGGANVIAGLVREENAREAWYHLRVGRGDADTYQEALRLANSEELV